MTQPKATPYVRPNVIIKPISSSQTVPLRHSILWPHKDPSFVILPAVDDLPSTLHLGAFVEGSSEPVCVVTLVEAELAVAGPGPALQARKFATATDWQGKGVGTVMLERVWEEGRKRGVRTVWCDARKGQEAFYARRGMRRDGEVFEKSGEEYVVMIKDL